MKITFVALLAVLLTGCATIFSGTTQNIHVKVVDAANQALLRNVNCTVTDGDAGMYPLSSNPGVISVSKRNGAIVIHCKKAGYRQLNNMAVGDSFNALTVVNILFWPGFIVDAVSGAYRKYPSHYMISMEKTS